MSTVRLMFSTTRLPLSALIRVATWSRWSHVALVDDVTVIEATALHGVRRAPLAEAIARTADHAFVDLPARDPGAVLAAAATQLRKPYDYTALLGLALRRDWQAADAWFCSELVAWSFEAAGQPLLRHEVVRRVTPQHLWMLPPARDMPDLAPA
ncbi:YiiX/YebB-like N1pC/P60 family cysteine hydrolase [Cupriavidus taiwanensis]|uniref:Permuted papain-like amidase enzyme, YaeF/YiiX, C92 family n=1 Tax=Cupriavidus taiwanensis TaxID=164546 RepID=A0A375J6F3_9BURK|nr:YiiX/YebB-like N1pC/P60 family cysteine hydrolase [Cupriavidus taiwanensis]SPR99543.1 conserved hypothetical protein [Cupriavidus taiwanensis]